MAVTKKIIIDDIILRLTEGKPTDDFPVPRAQISYMIDSFRDEVVANSIQRATRNRGYVNPLYIEKEALKSLVSENDGSVDCGRRHYVTLDKEPIWVEPDDKGIVLVELSNGTSVERVQPSDFHALRVLDGAKPTYTNPVWVREGKKMFVDEFTDIQANEIKINVHYVPTIGYSTDETSNYPIDDSDKETLTEMVTEELKKQMNGTVYDTVEDGIIDKDR
jgi:hypothetical protein